MPKSQSKSAPTKPETAQRLQELISELLLSSLGRDQVTPRLHATRRQKRQFEND